MGFLDFELTPAAPLSIASLLVSLGIGLPLSLVLRWHFQKFGSTLSNRSEFAQVFPLLVLTTVLIITVVKSSLALSLGLVGALSIVRFRTPIKEPEELAYLFFAIAMGLGLGADQTLPTVVASTVILTAVAILRWLRSDSARTNLYLSVEFQPEADSGDRPVDALGAVVSRHVTSGDLRRVDARNGSVEATYYVEIPDPEIVATLIDDLQRSFPGIGVTFIDQNQLPSV